MIRSFARSLIRFPLKGAVPRYLISENNPEKTKKEENFVYEQIKTNQAIAKNLGMNQFLMRIYNTTGLSILGALGSAFMFMSMPFVYTNMGMSVLLGAIMTIGGFVGTSYMRPVNVI